MDLTEPIEIVDGHTHDHVEPPRIDADITAQDVVLAALAQPLPCPSCGRTEPCRCIRPEGYNPTVVRADLVVKALQQQGFLHPDEDPAPFDPEEVAQYLADRSGFVRYTGDGWKRLIESSADVEVATAKALLAVATAEVEPVKAARAALLEWHRTKPSPQPDPQV